ncbi:MAG TPA: 6-bladed beta-propeller [Candidatus Deferrimicrobium sp.]|nr:6-bladed beta-propeller [Candidatus Deferrimicrobium sp.]
MKKRYFLFLLMVSIISIDSACKKYDRTYNQESWLNAFKKQEVLIVNPEKVTVIEEIYKQPGLMAIDDEYFYILNGNEQTINIYSKNDSRFKSTFGRKGEGPGEFRSMQGFQVYPNYIFINSPGKNSYFSKKGELIKEIRCPPELIPCLPVGNNYVTRDYSKSFERDINSPSMETKIILVGPDFKTIKVLFQKSLDTAYVFNSKTGQKEAWLFPDSCSFKIYKDNIYIGLSSMESFFFEVFDANGNRLYEINRPYPKREIPGVFKEAIRKKQYQTQTGEGNLKVKIQFYDYFPSFCNFEVADDRIYVFLYPELDRQRVLIMDLKGKLLAVNLVPFDLKSLEKASFRTLFSNLIYNGERYYIKDNLETDKWELWRSKICEIGQVPAQLSHDK